MKRNPECMGIYNIQFILYVENFRREEAR